MSYRCASLSDDHSEIENVLEIMLMVCDWILQGLIR